MHENQRLKELKKKSNPIPKQETEANKMKKID